MSNNRISAMNYEPPSRENNWNQSKGKLNQYKQQQQQLENQYHQQQDHQQQQQQWRQLNSNSSKHNINSDQKPIHNRGQIQRQDEQIQDDYSHHQAEQNKINSKESISVSNKKKTQGTTTIPYSQLLNMFNQNAQIIVQLKDKISAHRDQLKKIGQQVDNDLQKSMLDMNTTGDQKTNKLIMAKNAVNIKELFSASKLKSNKNEPQNIKSLREQLQKLRKQAKQVKQIIKEKSELINDPVNLENFYKQQQMLSKLKLVNTQLFNKKREAVLIKEEVKRVKQSAKVDQLEETQKSLMSNEEAVNKVINQVKEEKSVSYRLQKEDIFLSEKLKFLTQRNSSSSSLANGSHDQNHNQNNNNRKKQQQLKQKLRVEVSEIVQKINAILQERNKIQTQRMRLLKTLNSQVEQYERKNLATVAELRSIDAFLLQHYSQKRNHSNQNHKRTETKTASQQQHSTPKRNSKANNNMQKNKHQQNSSQSDNMTINQEMQQSGILNTSLMSKSKEISITKFNDKNIQIDPNTNKIISKTVQNPKFRTKVTVSSNTNTGGGGKESNQNQFKQEQGNKKKQEGNKMQQEKKQKDKYKKTSYIVGDMKVDQKGAILSDEILGQVKIKEITLYIDQQNIYGLYCKYVDGKDDKQVNGMKICEKIADEIVERVQLKIDQQKQICKIRVGYSSGMKREIKFLAIFTRNKQEQQLLYEWTAKSFKQTNRTNNNNSNNMRIEEIEIRQYQSMTVKAKLISSEEIQAVSKSLNELGKTKPKLKLAGFTLIATESIN